MAPSNVQNNATSRWRARATLVALVCSLAFCVGLTLSPLKSGYAEGARFEAPGDVALYNAEIRRIRNGESYYDAAASELRSRGFPTASVFNWRTPLPMWLIGRLPEPAGKVLLGALAVLLLVSAFLLVAREGGLSQATLCVLLLFGAVMPCFLGELYAMPVLWAGTLIGLSLCAYGHGRVGWAVACGLAALFCRDLAAGYCLLCLVLAVVHRRPKEAAAWLAGLFGYALFFLWHATQVLSLLGSDELAHSAGWLQLGGAAFVISTVQLNAYLLVSPQWLSAILFIAALFGAAAWRSAAGHRVALTLCLYVVAFAFVGHDFNQYWGAMTAPMFALAAAWFPRTLRELHAGISRGALAPGCRENRTLARRG